jgi:hypothetical protein
MSLIEGIVLIVSPLVAIGGAIVLVLVKKV